MGLGRPKVALILTDDERIQLDSLAHRSRTAPHLARRARIILACAEGIDNRRVAKRLRMSEVTVCKWRGRFVRERLDGLYDEPRPGAPRRISDTQIEQVIVRTLEETPRGETHWSSRGMAKATGLGRTSIQEIWRAFGLQPHRAETFKLSTDPLLIDKVRDIVGLYMHTFCSHLAMRGAPARGIQELAGHADLRTTQRYMHLSPWALDAAIRLLESPCLPRCSGEIVEKEDREEAK